MSLAEQTNDGEADLRGFPDDDFFDVSQYSFGDYFRVFQGSLSACCSPRAQLTS
jgi:hypothetical protein